MFELAILLSITLNSKVILKGYKTNNSLTIHLKITVIKHFPKEFTIFGAYLSNIILNFSYAPQ